MNIENITSNEMGLSNNGRFMQIEIYEKEIKRLNNIIDEIEKWLKKILEVYDNVDVKTLLMIQDKVRELKENNNE